MIESFQKFPLRYHSIFLVKSVSLKEHLKFALKVWLEPFLQLQSVYKKIKHRLLSAGAIFLKVNELQHVFNLSYVVTLHKGFI